MAKITEHRPIIPGKVRTTVARGYGLWECYSYTDLETLKADKPEVFKDLLADYRARKAAAKRA